METQNITEKVITNSSQVDKIKYNKETKVLAITYKLGKIYEYNEVPESVWDGLLAAESVGKYVSRSIKGIYNFKFIG